MDKTAPERHGAVQGMSRLTVDVERLIDPGGIQMLHQGKETTGLARLARCVEQKKRHALNQRQDLLEIPTRQGRQEIMLRAMDRAFGVEEAHRRSGSLRVGVRAQHNSLSPRTRA